MVPEAQISEKTLTSQRKLNSLDIPVSLCSELLQKHGMTLYEIIWFENNINDTQIFKLLHQILDRACEQINSPSLLTPKVSLFFTAHHILSGTKKNTPNKTEKEESNTVFSNPLINAVRQLPYEKRFIYLLRTRESFSYRDLETISIRHRDEISSILTETREFLRIQLSKELLLPFSDNSELCALTYKYLSPYLDNELNALNIMDIERHICKCDKCLQILANHQYIHKQINNLQLISTLELLSHFWAERSIKESRNKLNTSGINQKKKHLKNRLHLFSKIWNFIWEKK